MLDALVDPVRYPEFLPGLLAGAVALVAGTQLVRGRSRPAPVAGGLLVAAVATALLWRGLLTVPLVAGLALLAIAGAVGRPGGRSRGARLAEAVLVVAATLVLTAPLAGVSVAWRLAVAAAGAGLVTALGSFDRRSAHAGAAPLLLLLTAAGLYATLPDTEEARALLAAAAPLALLGWPRPLARLGPVGAPVLAGLLLYVIAAGGQGRAGAVIGAAGALGLLVADPLARLLRGRSRLDRWPATPSGLAVLGAVQLAVALVASRTAGLRESAGAAALVALPLLAVVTAVLALPVRPRGPRAATRGGDPLP